MKKDSKVRTEVTIGMDLGDRYSRVCVLDEAGLVLEEARLATTPVALRRRFGSLPATRIAIEVGTHSPWVKRLLEQCGHEVLVANTRKVRLIYQNDTKSDRVDAEWLARLARLDPKLLAPINHRSARCQADLMLLRSREALVRARSELVNHVRGAVKAVGVRLQNCSTECFHKKVAGQIPPELKLALGPVLTTISSLTDQIRTVDESVAAIARKRYSHTELLTQVSGVGILTGLCFVLTLEDPERFPTNRAVGAYLGLTPRKDQSGHSDPQLRITKAGDTGLRRLLVLSAHYILGPFGPDTDLRRWGLALAQRGGKNGKKRAVVAVARRLAVLLLSLWRTAQVYEPLGYATRQAEAARKSISA